MNFELQDEFSKTNSMEYSSVVLQIFTFILIMLNAEEKDKHWQIRVIVFIVRFNNSSCGLLIKYTREKI